MKTDISMWIDMREEVTGCMVATLHEGEKSSITIHGANCPATIELTVDQAFDLYLELKGILKKVQLALKKRR